jgi:PTS system galactitol-specific IIA component
VDLLNEKFIILQAEVETAEDCIQLMAERFYKYGYVKEGYAQAVMDREKEYPTGLPGKEICIAIPHTNSEYVNKPVVGVIVPQKPVQFRMMGTEDTVLNCEIIIPLVVKDSKMQLSMLQKITKIINDSELLRRIKQAKEKSEVITLLSCLQESK